MAEGSTLINEASRLAALASYDILDTPPEQHYDDLVALAAYMCDAPTALISFVDRNRQWFKARCGLDTQETSRDVAFCAHAIMSDDVLVIPDALADDRFCKNPLVTAAPFIRFYAGAPLITPTGEALGTLCVIDYQPRVLSPEQLTHLRTLARHIMSLLDLRLKAHAIAMVGKNRSEFTAMVAHEIRTPMSSIKMALDLTIAEGEGPLTMEQHDTLQVAKGNIDRLTRLVNNILDVTKLNAGCMDLSITQADTSIILQEVVDTMGTRLAAKNLQCAIETAPESIQLACDTDKIKQVIMNLMDNAIKFSPERGRIDMAVETVQAGIDITIRDHGPGIPPQDRKKIFQIFSQVHDQEEWGSGGTGVGLAFCKKVMDLHRGTIDVANDHGTKFILHFPYH